MKQPFTENLEKKIDKVIPDKPVYPNLGQAFGLIGMLVLVMVIVSIVALLFKNLLGIVDLNAISGITYTLSMMIILAIGMRLRRSIKFQWGNVQWSILFLVFPTILCLDVIIEPLTNVIPMPDVFKNMFSNYLSNDLNTFLTIAIAAPLFEELVFRGIILQGFLKRYSPMKSIIWSAAIFGIAHLNPWQFLAAFPIGLLIGWLYWKTNSLLPGILIHFISNTFSFILLWFTNDNFITIQQLMGDGKSYYLLYGMCIPIFLGSLFLISQRIKMKDSDL
jgi:membrane protease YdiL (CAAX protease family)